VALLLLTSVSGCALWDRFFGKEEEKAADILMKEGLAAYEDGNYEAAAEVFQQIKDRYPYSEFSAEAELRIADALFEKKEYEEAYQAYSEFEKLHPTNDHIPYVVYQQGMCDFEQMTTIDRDQSHTLAAKEAFERLVKRFPRSPYAAKARNHIRKCLIFLAEYELYVGKFYYDRRQYQAAMDRFRYVLENYPDLGQYHEALEYMNKCKDMMLHPDKGRHWWWLPDYFS
jgi:outer membrane protein assembly factor BamD